MVRARFKQARLKIAGVLTVQIRKPEEKKDKPCEMC